MPLVNDFPPKVAEDRERFLDIIQGSLRVRRHFDLYCWLQGDLQRFLPHEIMLAAWGDLKLGLLYVDVISPIPHMRTGPVIDRDITPFVRDLFGRWQANGGTPLAVAAPDGFKVAEDAEDCSISDTFRRMRSAIAHGIRDERGQHYCLYTVFSTLTEIAPATKKYMEVLLPHIDTALRQVTHLPEQRQNTSRTDEPVEDFGLSDREIEIMEWVRTGKTNEEIGVILSISSFTVKNHLQRIFRKLDVSNRAQAVAKFSKFAKPPTTS